MMITIAEETRQETLEPGTFSLMPQAIARDPAVHGSVRVLVAICNIRTNNQEGAWASMSRLRMETGGMSLSQIRHWIAFWEQRGHLKREARHRADGSQESNYYRLIFRPRDAFDVIDDDETGGEEEKIRRGGTGLSGAQDSILTPSILIGERKGRERKGKEGRGCKGRDPIGSVRRSRAGPVRLREGGNLDSRSHPIEAPAPEEKVCLQGGPFSRPCQTLNRPTLSTQPKLRPCEVRK